MRRMLPYVLALALVLMTASSVLAAKPTRQPSTLPPALYFAAGELCPFAAHVDFVVNRQVDTLFFNRNGDLIRIISTGALRAVLTSPDYPGRSLERNISGPVHQTFHPDGSFTVILGGRSASPWPSAR
jgi:hypothetical protein